MAGNKIPLPQITHKDENLYQSRFTLFDIQPTGMF